MQVAVNRLIEAGKELRKKYPIGSVIHYSAGGILYMSSKGPVTLDDWRDLEEARREDDTICSGV